MKYIKNIKWSELFDSSMNIEIPDIQRIIDNAKVNEIVKYQTDFYMKHGEYLFFGVITFCKYDKTMYLIDGQHRYFSMKSLFDKYSHNFDCNIEVIDVKSLSEVNEIYEIINKNTLLPNFKFTKTEKNIVSETCQYFQIKYPNIWSSSQRSRRPHIYFNSFQESIGFIAQQMDIQSSQNLIQLVEEKNKSYENSNKEVFKNVNDNMLKKAHEHGFYLGLFTFDINEEYGFVWAKSIVEYHMNIKIKKTHMNSRKRAISKSMKSKLWNEKIGTEVGEVYCIVCMNNKINMMNFECGHIVPESKGGETSVDNLLPICGLCNKSMATKHMRDYVLQEFPENMKGFDSGTYFSTKVSKNHKSFFKIF
jgi:hypothetical protein